jgi:hypothetical protein
MLSGHQVASRIVWGVWAIGLGFVGYSASQSLSYTAWFAPVWIFLPLLFINFEQLLSCFQRSRTLNKEAATYDKSTCIEVFVTKSLENGEVSTSDTCVICLFDFEEGDSIRRLQCNHSFHKQCIDKFFRRQVDWVEEHEGTESELHQRTVCPICRQDILKRQRSETGAASTAVV